MDYKKRNKYKVDHITDLNKSHPGGMHSVTKICIIKPYQFSMKLYYPTQCGLFLCRLLKLYNCYLAQLVILNVNTYITYVPGKTVLLLRISSHFLNSWVIDLCKTVTRHFRKTQPVSLHSVALSAKNMKKILTFSQPAPAGVTLYSAPIRSV